MYLLQTERTAIRKLSLDDAPFIAELVNSPGWLRYIGNSDIHDIHGAEEYLKNAFMKYHEQPGYGYYLAQTRNGDPMGICGFLKKPYLEYEDFGFAFLAKYHGQGLGIEVGRAVLDYGVKQFSFKVLDAVTHVDNVPSIALLKKLGFQSIGVIDFPTTEPGRLFRWRCDVP